MRDIHTPTYTRSVLVPVVDNCSGIGQVSEHTKVSLNGLYPCGHTHTHTERERERERERES